MIFTKWFHKQAKKHLIKESKAKTKTGFVVIKYVWNGYVFIIITNKFGKYKSLFIYKQNFEIVKGFKKYFVAVVTIIKLKQNHKQIMKGQ